LGSFLELYFSSTNEKDEKNSRNKKGLNYSLGNNHVPKGARLKLLGKATVFLGEKKFILFKDMIIPWEKKV
jgi:hypothetical protein